VALRYEREMVLMKITKELLPYLIGGDEHAGMSAVLYSTSARSVITVEQMTEYTLEQEEIEKAAS
jgi:hypothetical protein